MIIVDAFLFAVICVILGALGGSLVTWALIPHDRIHVTVLPEDEDLITPDRAERIHSITANTRSDGA